MMAAAWRRRAQRDAHMLEQRAGLVNVKIKWVKDRALDRVVARERHLRPVLNLLHAMIAAPQGPQHHIIPAFLHSFPALFRDSRPTDDALLLHQEELRVLRDAEPELVDRLRRLLMLTVGRSLPLHTVDQLAWDMGLPPRYQDTLLPRYPDLFGLLRPQGDERVWLRLLSWDPCLAVSELQKSSAGDCLSFPVSFTRGFGLRNKCLAWLHEWQTLPYTSPYADASGLDPRTDISEKRNVGVFHELLHLTLAKKTERRNVSNLGKPLALPHKFTKVFERHPGIFYISHKLSTQTVVLREAYPSGGPWPEHPILAIRERYAALMRTETRTRRDAAPAPCPTRLD